jgi:hypothetical protein
MTTPETLRKKRESYSVSYYEFVKAYATLKDFIYLFFEGEDLKYYGIRIEKYTRNYIPLCCGGKDGVLKIRELIKKNYPGARVAFFVDKDFDNNDGNHENLFTTRSYSIENYYILQPCLESILKQEIMISDMHEEYKIAISGYMELKIEYIRAVYELNLILMYLRRNGYDYVKLNLQSFNIMKYISVNLTKISGKLTREKIIELFKLEESIIDDKKLKALEGELGEQNHEMWIRGKFMFEFFLKYLHLLAEDANTAGGIIFRTKRACKMKIDRATALSDLAKYAITPPELDAFLENRCNIA